MNTLTPLQSLSEPQAEYGATLPLPAELSSLYGQLRFPLHPGLPYVIANFVSTLDGVVSLEIPGHSGGGEISGFNLHDRMVMGVLRAVADAVIVGAGTLRAAAADHLWTAAYIFPALAEAYQQLRIAMGKPEPPLNVVVTARGEVDLSQRVFHSGEVPVLIVTTAQGEKRLRQQPLPASVQVAAAKSDSGGELSAGAVLEAVNEQRHSDVILVEGGPHLLGNFLAEKCLDELFLTFAPQVAGREKPGERPGFVAGKRFAPEQPLWGALTGAKRAGSHLFLRYTFKRSAP
jgi:riboflavin biosynthesis pyrimidine reductase